MIRKSVNEDELINEYLKTKSVYLLTKKFNLGATTIYRKLEKAGIKRDGIECYRKNARLLTDDQEKEIKQLYETGKSINEISELKNISFYVVRSSLRRTKTKVKKRGNVYRTISDENIKKIIDLYLTQKLSQRKIAEILNIGQVQISRILRREGVIIKKINKNHGSWKGGRCLRDDGYVQVMIEHDNPHYDMANRMGYVMEHRLVMAKSLGRNLYKKETVHHINGIRNDNRLENLQLRKGRHGSGIVYKCGCCGSKNIIEDKLD